MYFNNIEEKTISTFMGNLTHINDEILTLKWESGSAKVQFDTCFEDIDDKTDEEFHSFVFIVCSKTGNPPLNVTDENYCIINYKNFPDEILMNGEKIN